MGRGARGCGNLDVFIGTTLVDKYGKCGLLGRAYESFELLRSRDVVAWTSLISGYAQHGHGKEAFLCFESMKCEGLLPNTVTYVCILNGCSRMGVISKGREIHAEIVQEGLLDKSIVVGNALVNMYAKAGDLNKAEEVFDGLPYRNVISWTALIAGYAQCKRDEEALNCFERMQYSGLPPDGVIWACVLQICGNMRAIIKGRAIHMEVVKKGLFGKDVSTNNGLLGMYAKCGAVTEVHKVLKSLQARGIVSWNAIISGYAENENYEGVLDCFKKMQDTGIHPDASTFICILKACGNANAIDMGKKIHGDIVIAGMLESNMLIGTALIDMYGKCGALVKAREVFEQLPVWDVVSWTALISAYAQHGYCEEALNCFRQMQCGGFSPDKVTYTCILKVCGSSMGTIHDGREIHMHIVREEFPEKDDMIKNALVDMYMKCSALVDAQRMFNMLTTQGVAAWNTMITGYVHHGFPEIALDYFDRMKCNGLPPDSDTFHYVLEAYNGSCLRTLDKGKERHIEILHQGYLKKDTLIGNALLDMYSRLHAPLEAQEVFDETIVRDTVSWNLLVMSYSHCGFNAYKVLAYFARMKIEGFLPSINTYACALNACGNLKASHYGRRIHVQILKECLLEEKDNVAGNSLVDMYGKCGFLAKAQQVFDALPCKNVISWTALISAYVQHAHNNKALSCFRHMQQEGICPDIVTYSFVLKACGNMQVIKDGIETHAKILREWLEKDILVGNMLIDMYCKCGLLAKAQEVFNELLNRNAVTWGLLISAYAHYGYCDSAVTYFQQMELEGSFSLDSISYVHVLKACGSIGAFDKGIEIHEKIKIRWDLHEKHGLIGNALVDMYAKCGQPTKAQEAFDQLLNRDVVSWTALMAGYAQVGRDRIVLDSYERMIGEGINPDVVTFTVLLNACSDAGLLDEGKIYFETMIRTYDIIPTQEHCACMVDLFSRAGQFDKALVVIERMPRFDHVPTWATLLGACKKWGYLKLGELAFEHLVQLDGNNAAGYVSMSNIYAAASATEGTYV